MPSPEISIDLASQDKQKHAPEIQLILFYFNDLQRHEDGIQAHEMIVSEQDHLPLFCG